MATSAQRTDPHLRRDYYQQIAQAAGIPVEHLYRYGPHKAKVSLPYVQGMQRREGSKLILVTATSPTPAGEGKTTTTVGLVDGLAHIGETAAAALREPSMGPVFGMKGGAKRPGAASKPAGGTAEPVPAEAESSEAVKEEVAEATTETITIRALPTAARMARAAETALSLVRYRMTPVVMRAVFGWARSTSAVCRAETAPPT